MSKRLQVLFEDKEYQALHKVARRKGLTMAEWVRQSLRTASQAEPLAPVATKLAALKRAAQHNFPTADIDQMLAEISQDNGSLP